MQLLMWLLLTDSWAYLLALLDQAHSQTSEGGSSETGGSSVINDGEIEKDETWEEKGDIKN